MALTIVLEGQANLGVTTGVPATITLQLGTPGPAGTIVVGSTTTSAPGGNASVVNVGTVSNAVFDFTIPRGIQGTQGVQGEQGVPGQAGAKGDKGDTGAGVPTGGSTGQFLSKASNANYDTSWVNVDVSGYLPLTGGTMSGSLNVAGDYSNLFIQVTDNEGPNYSRLQQDGTIVSHSDGYSDLTINASSGISMPSGSVINFAATSGRDSQVGAWGFGVEDGEGSYTTVVPTAINTQFYYPESTDPDNAYPAGFNSGYFCANGAGGSGDNGINNYGWAVNWNGVNGNPSSDHNWGLSNLNVGGNIGQADDNWSLGLNGLAIKQQGTFYGFDLSGITFSDGTVQTTAATSFDGGLINNALIIHDNPIFDLGVFLDSGGLFGRNDSVHYTYDISKFKLTESEVMGGVWDGATTNPTVYWSFGFNGLHFSDGSTQSSAFIPSNYLTASSIASTYLTQSSAAATYYTKPAGTTSQYIRGNGTLATLPPSGDRYLTSSTSTLTCDSGNGKTMTVGTDLSYTQQQDITVVYNNANHMHGTVTSYNSTTGVLVFDSNTHSGSGTYSNWEVNVGGVAGAVLPVDGSAGQVLSKINSTNYNTEWTTPYSGTDALKKASNLSDLTSSSTARTNLGLGSMALETASNYLTASSTAGVYLSQSSAASTYQPISGMSAYTTKANNLSDVASASTSRINLGLSSVATALFATNAESNKGTSASTVLTPSNALWTAMSPALHATTTFSTNNLSTGGTGGTTVSGDTGARAFTGTTANSYGAVRNGALTTFPTSRGTSSGIDFSKIVIASGTCLINPLNSVATNRFLFGTTNTGQLADLANRGIGMRQVGTSAVELQVHNGTTLTNVTSSFTPTANTAFDFVIYSDGAGGVTLYVNDSSVATTASGPSAAGSTTQNFIGIGSEISANVASQTFYSFGNIKTYLGR